jgi:hypothetical protein
MYIGVYPEKFSQISGNMSAKANVSNVKTQGNNCNITKNTDVSIHNENQKPVLTRPLPTKNKDWSAKFSAEEKVFLQYLLDLKPEVGDGIEKDHATWWIKQFGIEKIKTALQVYWQRVEMAKKDATPPMPKHIGKYVRKALNDGLRPFQSSCPPCIVQNSDQGRLDFQPGSSGLQTTNTYTSMTSMIINEVNDVESLTFQAQSEKQNILNKNEDSKIPKKFPSELVVEMWESNY